MAAALVAVVAVLLAATTLSVRPAEAAITTPFTTRFDVNTNGSVLIRGNSNLTCTPPPPSACGNARNGIGSGAALNNNNYTMVYTDTDGDLVGTFNDSTSTLDMPAGSTVLFAGLYWGADSSLAPTPAGRNLVKFRTPAGSTWNSVTASSLYASGSIYQGFADVTALVSGVGDGVYAVANIQASAGVGYYAGWALVVAYRNPAEDMRSLRVYDGFGTISSGSASSVNIPVTGFETPHTGTVHAKVGAVAYEGDLGSAGDNLLVDGVPLVDGQNQLNNFFNSTASDSGAAVGGRNPPYPNLMGFDVDQVDATGVFGHGITSTTLTLTTASVGGETYYPGVITFAIDLYAPKISTTMTATDVDGGDLLRGDTIEYRIAVRNDGSDTADNLQLADAIPPYTTYVPGSLTIQGVPASDATADDDGWFGAGTANWMLGSIPYAGTTYVTFRVTVDVGTPAGYAITNLVNVSYTGHTTSVSVAAQGGNIATPVLPPHVNLAAGLAVTPAFVQRANTPATVNYTVTVTNRTGALEPDASGALTLPSGLTPGPLPAGCTAAGQVVTCDLGPLVAGSSANATVPATVDNTAAASAVATLSAISSGTDTDPTDDTATAAVAVNTPPHAVADTATTTDNAPVSIPVVANDSDPDDPQGSLAVSISGGPAHGTAVVEADRSVTYTPTPGWAGADTFQYQLADPNGGTDTGTVTVTTANAAPIAHDDMLNTPTNTPVTVNVLGNDSDPNGDPLTVVGVAPPAAADGTVTFTGTQVTFAPTPAVSGTVTFGYTVRDSAGATATATVSVDVANAAPTAQNDTLSVSYAAAQAGVVLPLAANDTDPNHDTLNVASVSPLSGGQGTASVALGVVTYQAPAHFSGVVTFDYVVDDGHSGQDLGTVTLTVQNAVPAAAPFTAGTAYLVPATFDAAGFSTDPNNDPLRVSGTTDPAHGTVGLDTSGRIVYQPDVAWSGVDTFTYTIDDGNGGSDTGTVTVTVANGVAVARDDAATVVGGGTAVIDVLANDDDDPNGQPLTVTTGPAGHGTMTVGADRRITYRPAAGYLGTDTFHYQLDDGAGGVAGANVTVTVVNTAPVARSDSVATGTNTPVIIPVLANDDDPNGDAVTLTALGGGAHGTVADNGDGTVTYTPANGFYGSDSFAYSIRDPSWLTDSAIVTVTVANAAPIAGADSYPGLRPGVAATLPVLDNDSDPNTGQVISVASVTAATKGSLTLTGGVLTYRADPGTVGTDGFDYVLTDDLGRTDTAHVTLTINGSPTAVDDTVPVPSDTAIDIPVTGNDLDPESLPLTVTAVGPPGHGTAQINANGTVGYTPDAGFYGTDTFSYTISDDVGNTATGQVNVQVANADPIAGADFAALLSDRTVLIDVLGNDSDVNPGQTLGIVSAGPAAHGTVSVVSGEIRYAPQTGFTGVDTFPYTVGDGNGGTATAPVTVTVSDGEPVALPDDGTTPFGHAVTIGVLANDLDPAGTLSLTGVGTPDHGTATFGAGTVTYTPPNGFAGVATFDYTATDDAGHQTSAAVTITVGDAPVVPNRAVQGEPDAGVVIGLPRAGLDGRPVTLDGFGQPAHGTVVRNPDGTLTYTPDPGFTGLDSFTYQMIDADGNVATATIWVTVPPPASPSPSPSPSASPSPSPSEPSPSPSPSSSPPPGSSPPAPRNRAPIAADDLVIVLHGDTVVIRPLLNDRDPDGDPLTIVKVRQPRHGSVTIGDSTGIAAATAENALTYHADPAFRSGLDPFGYTVSDGRGGVATASITIKVSAGKELPVTGRDALALARAGLLAVGAGGLLCWLAESPRPGRHRR